MSNKPYAKSQRQLDQIDQRILNELQKNGRISHQELADVVGLSATPCARRVRALEDEGYIAGYTALIDERRLGFGFSVFISVKLERQIEEQLHRFESAIRACPEVVDCWLMTGNRDYLIRVVVRDLEDFEKLLTGKLTKFPGVASLESSIPIRRLKGQGCRIT